MTLGIIAPTLTDTVDLSNAYDPTGSLTFSLFANGDTSPVYSETDPVNANGVYTTLKGYILPTMGTVAGCYQWDVTYNGDPNNNPTSDNNDPNGAQTVTVASPTLTGPARPARSRSVLRHLR